MTVLMDTKQLSAIVRRRHPLYEAMKLHWEFLEDSYRGGRDYFTRHLHKYYKEGDSEFTDRRDRAYRFNHTREVVDLVTKYQFVQHPERSEDAPQALKDFWEKTDSRGIDMTEMMRIVSTKSSTFGCPWVVIDNSKQLPENASKKDEEEAEGGIYMYVVPPTRVLDMSWDERGNLNWILIYEEYRDDSDPLAIDIVVKDRYRLWTRNEWYLIELTAGNHKSVNIRGRSQLKVELKEQGKHNLGVVPVIRADHTLSREPYAVPALINDIAYLDRAVANYLSNLDAIIQDQTFSQLAMPAQGILPGSTEEQALLNAGTKRLFLFDGEKGVKPEYLSPDPRQASLIVSVIEKIINEIYHTVGLAGERTKQDNSKGIDNSSGAAKSKDFERVTALLSSRADALETLENRIASIVCLYAGEEKFAKRSDLVTYPHEFSTRDLWDEFDVAMRLSLMSMPDEVMTRQSMAVVDKLWPNMATKLRDEMQKEIVTAVKEAKERLEAATQGPADEKSKLLEEAKRNRQTSGDKQSETKGRKADQKN